MAKKLSAVFIWALALTICTTVLETTGAIAAPVKTGAPCLKVGTKSGALVCVSLNSILVWQPAKKAQAITVALPAQVSVKDSSVTISASSSSKLKVASIGNSPQICSIIGSKIVLTRQPGNCFLFFSQAGNDNYYPASSVSFKLLVLGINQIDFQLPGALLLSQGAYLLDGKSSSGMPVSYRTSSTGICSLLGNVLTLISSGKCAVSAIQSGSDIYPPATEVIRTVEISTLRVMADVADIYSGYQIKAIYVIPSDGEDHSYDTNGVLENVLNAGTQYLKEELGLTFQIDSTSAGYDVTYFRSSKPTDYFLNSTGAYTELMKEIGFLDSPSLNRKDYVFFVDTKTIVGPNYCGEASFPGNSAVVAIGLEECGKKTAFFNNYASQTWVHEVLHNLGLPHVSAPCDLMFSGQSLDGTSCSANQRPTIDINHTMYLGANVYGQDLLKLRVWNTYTGNQDLYADCWLSTVNGVPRSDGIKYALCPTGTSSIGPFSYCWKIINSVVLEEQVNGIWTTLGTGDYWNTPWGSRINWRCDDPSYVAPWKSITVTTPGLRHYRWLVNGTLSEEFNIIWQN